MTSNRTDRITAAVLFCVAIAVPVVCLWHAGTSMLPGIPRSDFEYYFYPQRVFLSRWLGRGIFPYWNPHLFSGYPVIELQQTALFYPLNSLSLALFSPAFGFILMLSLHVVLAGLLAWFTCAKCFDCSRIASVAGGLVYVFTAVFAYRFHAGHLTKVFIMAWMPPAIGCLAKAVRMSGTSPASDADAHGRGHWIILSGVCTGICILAGYPQYLFYLLWGQVAVTLFVKGVPWKRRLFALVVTGLIAVALSTPQWLPSLFYLPYSQRIATGYADTRSFKSTIAAFLEYVMHAPLGDGVHEVHLQARGVWDTAGYCGTVVLALMIALLAGWRGIDAARKASVFQSFGLLAAGCYLLCGGKLPGFSAFREPLKAIYLVNLASAFLLALGIDLLSAATLARPPRLRLVGLASLPVAAAAGAIVAMAYALPKRLAAWLIFISETDRDVHPLVLALVEAARSNPWVILGPLTKAGLWTLAVLAMFWLALLIARHSVRMALLLVAVLAVADPLLAHWHLFLPKTPLAGSGWNSETLGQITRITQPIRDGTSAPWRVYMPDAMVNSAELVDCLYEPRGYDPLMPSYSIGRAVFPSDRLSMKEAQALKPPTLGVRYRIKDLTATVPETTPQQSRQLRIEEICSTASIAALVSCVTPVAEPPEYGPIDGHVHFVSPKDARLFPSTVTSSDGTASRTLAHSSSLKYHRLDTPNSHEFEIATSSPAVLLVRVTWAPGWRVRINNRPAGSPARTNGWMMSVPVDASTRRVRLDYRPPGLRLSGFAAIATAAACILTLRRRRWTPVSQP